MYIEFDTEVAEWNDTFSQVQYSFKQRQSIRVLFLC